MGGRPPTPSPPSNSWRCINGQCQNVRGGIDKGLCLSACNPSKDLYKCINNTCVKNGTGVIKSVCGAVCGHHVPAPSPPPSAAAVCTAACNATCGADKANPSQCEACVQAHSAQLERACGGSQKQLQAASEALCYFGGGGGMSASQDVLHGGVSATNATIAGGLFGEGVKALGEDEWAAHDWTTNNQTQYLIATASTTCLQIPVVMKNKSLFCHGPYPRADRSGFEQDWVAGKGSCKEQGPGALGVHSVRIPTCDPCAFCAPCAAGFDHGPQDTAANVTGQADMHQCHFTNWDFDHLLPLNERQSSWYKKVTHSHVVEH